MSSLAKAIKEVEKMIDINMFGTKNYDSSNLFDGFQRVYFQANENIDDYLKLTDYSTKETALCVAGSGDQAFSLISKGIRKVELFDINKLTEYMIIGLKKAIILKYDYSKYFKIMYMFIDSKINFREIYNIINGLIPYMEEKYQNFWLEIINYYKMLQLKENTNYNLIKMLSLTNVEQLIKNNASYLNSKEDYELLRSNLDKCLISFKYANALNLKNEFKDKYDLILLSNILDYFHIYWGSNWPIAYLENYVNGLEGMLQEKGVLYIHYAFTPYIWPRVFNSTNIKINNLPASFEVKEIDNIYNLKQKDSIILKRKL